MRLNRNIIHKTTFDSRFVNILACTVHRLTEPGAYFGTVYLKKEIVATFEVRMDTELAAAQVNIDIDSLLAQRKKSGQRPVFQVGQQGHVLFCATKSNQAYRVRLSKDPAKSPHNFDSKQLQANDLYITQYFRPGKYVATHSGLKGQALDIEVTYPERQKHSRSGLYQQKNVSIQKDNFSEDCITLLPLQALVFTNMLPGHITIELVEAYAASAPALRPAATDVIKAKVKQKLSTKTSRKYQWRNGK